MLPNPYTISQTIFLLQAPMSHTLSSSIAYKPFPVNELPTTRFRSVATRCTLNDQSSGTELTGGGASKLNVGSPIIITEAPKMIKTAASVPCLRVNSGLLNPGDVGRIVSRKPMNVWAVRLSIGTYLIDEKYFKPLQLDE